MTGVVIVAIAVLGLGMAVMVLGILRTVTRRQAPAFRKAVATTLLGSGIGAFGLALLIIGVGSNGARMTAGAVVGVIGFGQLVIAAVIRRASA